jgi:uncharacterized protein (DUF697 family)
MTEAMIEPSVNEVAALESVRRHMAWSAAGGLLPMPGLEVPAILAIQLKKLSDIAHIYEVPFTRHVVKAAVSGLLGNFFPVAAAQGSNSAIKSIPIIGPFVALIWQPALAAAATWAVGKVFMQHFESGSRFLDFKSEAIREYFRKQYDAARSGLRGRPAAPRTHAHVETPSPATA